MSRCHCSFCEAGRPAALVSPTAASNCAHGVHSGTFHMDGQGRRTRVSATSPRCWLRRSGDAQTHARGLGGAGRRQRGCSLAQQRLLLPLGRVLLGGHPAGVHPVQPVRRPACTTTAAAGAHERVACRAGMKARCCCCCCCCCVGTGGGVTHAPCPAFCAMSRNSWFLRSSSYCCLSSSSFFFSDAAACSRFHTCMPWPTAPGGACVPHFACCVLARRWLRSRACCLLHHAPPPCFAAALGAMASSAGTKGALPCPWRLCRAGARGCASCCWRNLCSKGSIEQHRERSAAS